MLVRFIPRHSCSLLITLVGSSCFYGILGWQAAHQILLIHRLQLLLPLRSLWVSSGAELPELFGLTGFLSGCWAAGTAPVGTPSRCSSMGRFHSCLGICFLRLLYGACRAHNCSLFFLVRALVYLAVGRGAHIASPQTSCGSGSPVGIIRVGWLSSYCDSERRNVVLMGLGSVLLQRQRRYAVDLWTTDSIPIQVYLFSAASGSFVGLAILAPTYLAFFKEALGYTERAGAMTRRAATAATQNALDPGAFATFASPYLTALKFLPGNPKLWPGMISRSLTFTLAFCLSF